jgi:hypothetical protein
MAAAAVRGAARAAVADLQRERVRRPRDAHPRGRARAVLADVRERLLHDPVGGQVEAGRHRSWLAVDVERHRHARVARVRDELAELREPGLR